jgi:hypothetical protein
MIQGGILPCSPPSTHRFSRLHDFPVTLSSNRRLQALRWQRQCIDHPELALSVCRSCRPGTKLASIGTG